MNQNHKYPIHQPKTLKFKKNDTEVIPPVIKNHKEKDQKQQELFDNNGELKQKFELLEKPSDMTKNELKRMQQVLEYKIKKMLTIQNYDFRDFSIKFTDDFTMVITQENLDYDKQQPKLEDLYNF